MSPIAVVTGASRGVGLAVTKTLLHNGYQVFAHYRTTPADLNHQQLSWWQADFTEALPLDRLPNVEKLDALIHCAGIAVLGTQQPRNVWEQHMAVNLHSPVELTHALLPSLIAARGDVVYINSGAGLQAYGTWGAYSASKFAARGWCDALREEYPEIRVTSIFPGRIATDMQRDVCEQQHMEYTPEQYLQPNTIAQLVSNVLSTPSDAHINNINVRPNV